MPLRILLIDTDAARAEALAEKLIAFALQPAGENTLQTFADSVRTGSGIGGEALEKAINNSGYAIRSNLGPDAALRVFSARSTSSPTSEPCGEPTSSTMLP